MQYVRDTFAPIKKITGITAVDNSADSIVISGQPITFQVVTGNIWLNPLAVAVADATALKLTAGQTLDMVVKGTLSIISDVTGATYQIIYWEL